jgi:hypothetical protein
MFAARDKRFGRLIFHQPRTPSPERCYVSNERTLATSHNRNCRVSTIIVGNLAHLGSPECLCYLVLASHTFHVDKARTSETMTVRLAPIKSHLMRWTGSNQRGGRRADIGLRSYPCMPMV